MPEHPQPLDAVMDERRQLLNVAYRLLGSLVEAEDAVQETYARWYAMAPGERDAIDNPAAWLTKVASRTDVFHGKVPSRPPIRHRAPGLGRPPPLGPRRAPPRW